MTLRCPACRGARFDASQPVAALIEHRCGECGLLIGEFQRLGPPAAEFERVDEARYLRSVGDARRRQAKRILKLIGPVAAAQGTLLDVGCSFGFFLEVARDAGFKISGVEPDPQAWRHATDLLGDGVVEHGWFDGRAEDPADVVVTLDVIEHLPLDQQDEFARSVRRVLAPGGLWVIKVPSTEGLYYGLSRFVARVLPRLGEKLLRRMWQTEYEYPHTVYFDRPSLARWLSTRGFELVAEHYLAEVSPGTAVDRLTTDGEIDRRLALVLAPALYFVTLVDSLRHRSDALVAVARPSS